MCIDTITKGIRNEVARLGYYETIRVVLMTSRSPSRVHYYLLYIYLRYDYYTVVKKFLTIQLLIHVNNYVELMNNDNK